MEWMSSQVESTRLSTTTAHASAASCLQNENNRQQSVFFFMNSSILFSIFTAISYVDFEAMQLLNPYSLLLSTLNVLLVCYVVFICDGKI